MFIHIHSFSMHYKNYFWKLSFHVVFSFQKSNHLQNYSTPASWKMLHSHDFTILSNYTRSKLYLHQILCGWSNHGKLEGWVLWHVWGKERCTGFWWGNLKERGHLEDLDIGKSIKLKQILNTWDGSDLAHNMGRWRCALLNVVISLWIR